jgi:hypothetical protein
MLRCPNCRAQNPGTQQCRRCGIELAALQDISDTAKCLTLQALQLLATPDPQDITGAYDRLLKACTLQRDPLSILLLGFSLTSLD